MMNPEKCRKLHATLDAVNDMMKEVKEGLIDLCSDYVNDVEAPGTPDKEEPLVQESTETSYTEMYLD